MRLVARFVDKRQVSSLVDALKNIGFDRKDMIISQLIEEHDRYDEAFKGMAYIKTEREGLGETGTFSNGVKSLKSNEGIIVAVEIPMHESGKVRTIMEQSGADEIIQD